jgi:hypothetical protein
MKIRPVGAELFHVDSRSDGWADRLDESNNGFFLQFFERA